MKRLIPIVFLAGFALLAPSLFAAEPTPQQLEFFEQKIGPIFVNHCYGCHSAETKVAARLRVDDYNGILRGGQSGPAVVPGDPESSLLIARVSHTDAKRRMPKDGEALSSTEIANLVTWVRDGAAWPRGKSRGYSGKSSREI